MKAMTEAEDVSEKGLIPIQESLREETRVMVKILKSLHKDVGSELSMMDLSFSHDKTLSLGK